MAGITIPKHSLNRLLRFLADEGLLDNVSRKTGSGGVRRLFSPGIIEVVQAFEALVQDNLELFGGSRDRAERAALSAMELATRPGHSAAALAEREVAPYVAELREVLLRAYQLLDRLRAAEEGLGVSFIGARPDPESDDRNAVEEITMEDAANAILGVLVSLDKLRVKVSDPVKVRRIAAALSSLDRIG